MKYRLCISLVDTDKQGVCFFAIAALASWLYTLGMIVLPVLDPLCYPLDVAIDLVGVVASQFDHDLGTVGVSRLLKDNLHDLRVEVFL